MKGVSIIAISITCIILSVIILYFSLSEADRNFQPNVKSNIKDYYSPYQGSGLLGVWNTLVRIESAFDKDIHNRPIISVEKFKHHDILNESFEDIKKEALNVYKNYDIPSFNEVDKTFDRISNNNWKVFVLKWYDDPLEENCKICPKTCKVIESIPEIRCAMFSIIGPGMHIISHRGPFTGCLRYHIGIKIPKDRLNCFIRVADQKYSWKEGEGVLFDDTFEHEVMNNTDEVRIVLFMDVVRPLKGIIGVLNTELTKHAGFAAFVKNINDKGEKQISKKQISKKQK